METPKPTPTSCPLLTLEEAAKFLGGGCTVSYLRKLIADGEIRYLRVGKRFCVTPEALTRWIKTHETTQK
jgi:excisionase family DNA binding protein